MFSPFCYNHDSFSLQQFIVGSGWRIQIFALRGKQFVQNATFGRTVRVRMFWPLK